MEKWEQVDFMILWIIIVFLFFLLLSIGGIIFFRRYLSKISEARLALVNLELENQRKMLNDSIVIQEKERERIARDLHDGLMNKLNAMLLAIKTKSEGIDLITIINDTLSLAQRITYDLSPPLLERRDVSSLFEEVLESLHSGYEVTFERQELFGSDSLSNQQKLGLVRIFQEICNNIIKHAGAKKIQVKLKTTVKYVYFTISDDGIGFDPKTQQKGLGLNNIKSRAQQISAIYKYKSNNSQRGTQFSLLTPTIPND